MKITLDLTETQAIYVMDALRDKSIALRADAKDRIVKEDEFLGNPDYSDRRKQNYLTLRDCIAVIDRFIS